MCTLSSCAIFVSQKINEPVTATLQLAKSALPNILSTVNGLADFDEIFSSSFSLHPIHLQEPQSQDSAEHLLLHASIFARQSV